MHKLCSPLRAEAAAVLCAIQLALTENGLKKITSTTLEKLEFRKLEREVSIYQQCFESERKTLKVMKKKKKNKSGVYEPT